MQEVPIEDPWYIKLYWWCLIGGAWGTIMGLLFGAILLQR